MRVLVTGGCGFIGSCLVRLLVRQGGHQVLNLDALTYAGSEDAVAEVADAAQYRHARIDIRDGLAVMECVETFKPDWIVHLAAESHVDRSIATPDTFIQTNVIGTCNLLKAAREHHQALDGANRERFRFVHVSTDEVYGSLGEQGRFTEESRYDPHSPYAASKAASDHLARAWQVTYGLPVIVTHSCNNYGPWQFPEKLVPSVITHALRGEPIPVYGAGDNVRDWVHVEDHVRALLAVLEHGRTGESYNIGGNNEWRNIDLIRLLCAVLDDLRPLPGGGSHAGLITHVADRPGHDFRYAVDTGKLREQTGWAPQQDPATGFRETVRWYLDHQQWVERALAASPVAG